MTWHRRGNDSGAVALPITPMLDMSFQLLFFFIATFHLPTGMEGQMALTLPEVSVDRGPRPGPPDGDMAIRDDVTIRLNGDVAGPDGDGVSTLTWLSESGVTLLPYTKGLNELRGSLAELSASGAAPRCIKVQGDGKVKWRGVVRVMDACREAGFEDVTFAQPPDGGLR